MILKQKINGMSIFTGLNAVGLNTHPSARQLGFPKLEKDMINYKTGLNERAPEVMVISDDKTRKKVQEEIIAKRKKYEAESGLDLSANSTVWDSMELEFIRPRESEIIIDENNVMDMIKLTAMIASGYVAPSLEEAFSEKFINARVYVFNAESDNDKKFRLLEVKQEIGEKLNQIKDSQDRLYYLCKALGLPVNNKMSAKLLFISICEYSDGLKGLENYESFLAILSKDNKDLVVQQVVNEAFKRKLIFYKGGLWTWGGSSWGGTASEVIENFSKNEESFLKLKGETELR